MEQLLVSSSNVFQSSNSAVSPSVGGHSSAFESIWSLKGRSASVTLQSPKIEPVFISGHTVGEALSLVGLAKLDAKIFNSFELKSSDINFLNSVSNRFAKKKAISKKRR